MENENKEKTPETVSEEVPPAESVSESSEREADGAQEGSHVVKFASGQEVVLADDVKKSRDFVRMAISIIIAAIIRGFGTYCFISPNGFAVGGISGIALMLEHATHINFGYFNMAVNVPLLILAFFLLSKRYFFVTSAYTLILSGTTIVIEQIDKAITSFAFTYSEEPIMAAVFGGVMCGLSFTIMMRAGGSQGGTDIIGAIIQRKRPDISLSWLIFGLDSTVILSSFFVYQNGFTPVMLAIIEAFASSATSDKLIKGGKSAIKVEIITNSSNEISAEIFEKIHRGVTVVDAVGQYTGKEHKLLTCVIRRRQIGEMERIIKKYPDTFSYIMPANEVFGKWKK